MFSVYLDVLVYTLFHGEMQEAQPLFAVFFKVVSCVSSVVIWLICHFIAAPSQTVTYQCGVVLQTGCFFFICSFSNV